VRLLTQLLRAPDFERARVNTDPPKPVRPIEMTDQEAREFVELLAVPDSTDPPLCPLCGQDHPLEMRCERPSQDGEAPVAITGSLESRRAASLVG